jgi:hypothetical protein
MEDNYHVHTYSNHVLVDIYHVYENLYHVLGALSLTRNTYTMSIEKCFMYRNTVIMCIVALLTYMKVFYYVSG